MKKLSDETQCGLLLSLWIIAVSAGCLSKTAVGYTIAVFATVLTAVMFAMDALNERTKKSLNRTHKLIREHFVREMRRIENED